MARLIQGSPGRSSDEYGTESDDLSDEDDEEHIIVTMLRSMNSKKLETRQLNDMKFEIDIEKIRSEIKLEFFKRLQQQMDTKIENEWQVRMVRFDRLFNKIVAKKAQLDAINAVVIQHEERAKTHEQRLKNPFYVTLKAQKEERDNFIDFYQNGALFGRPAISSFEKPNSASDSRMKLYDALESEDGA